MMKSSAETKIKFLLPANAWHGHSAEHLWARHLKDDRFEILNSPFFAMDVSFGDTVATRNRSSGTLEFSEVVRHSGASTYRIIPEAKRAMHSKEWKTLESFGCSFEQGDFGFEIYSVHVPAEADIFRVYAILERAQAKRLWDFEEGHYGHHTL